MKECKRLQNLASTRFFGCTSFMVPILSKSNIHLTSLRYEGFVRQDSVKFYQTLANQTSSQILWLELCDWKEDVNKSSLVRADVLVDSLSELFNLTDLHLQVIAKPLFDEHIVQLASSLSKLEVWWMDGCWITDAVWDEFTSLSSLRRLELGAWKSFTVNGVLNFIKKLGPGNKGLVLTLMYEHNGKISSVEQELIQELISNKIKGRFELQGEYWHE